MPPGKVTSLGMIACENCGVANMAESKFCRDCGAHLVPAKDAPRSAEDLKMVQDAQRLFAEFRYDEAAMVADAILESDPFCIEALAIKGDCHERLGEYSQALACFRDLVQIDPDSQLDRIRVARLEKLVASGDIEVGRETPRRRTALAASIAAMLLLVSSGSALILAAKGGDDSEAAGQPIARDFQSSPFLPVPPVPSSGDTGYAPNNQAAPQDRDLEGIPDASNTRPMLPPGTTPNFGGNGTLPGINGSIVNGNGGTVDPEVRPLVPPGISPNGASTNRGTASGDPDPTVVSNKGEEDRGMIVDVRPSQGQGNDTGGTNVSAEDRGARIDTLIRVAREKQVVGDWARAADAYEKALALGASPASTNQRLAQCYEKLGKKAEAIKAYERAITAFEKLDPNDVRVQAQLEACRQALKLLRGN